MATKASTIKSRREKISGRSKRTLRKEFQTDVSKSIGKALGGFKEGVESGGGVRGIIKQVGKRLGKMSASAAKRKAALAKKRRDTGVAFATKETKANLKAAQKTLKTTTDRKAKKKALQNIQRNLGSKVAAKLGQKSVGKKGGKGAGGKKADLTPGQERLKRAFTRKSTASPAKQVNKRQQSFKEIQAEGKARKRTGSQPRGTFGPVGNALPTSKPSVAQISKKKLSSKGPSTAEIVARNRSTAKKKFPPKMPKERAASTGRITKKAASKIRDNLGALERGVGGKARQQSTRNAVKRLTKAVGSKAAAKITKKQVDKVFSSRGKSLTKSRAEINKAVARTKANPAADAAERASNTLKNKSRGQVSRAEAKAGTSPSLLEKSVNRPKGGFKPRINPKTGKPGKTAGDPSRKQLVEQKRRAKVKSKRAKVKIARKKEAAKQKRLVRENTQLKKEQAAGSKALRDRLAKGKPKQSILQKAEQAQKAKSKRLRNILGPATGRKKPKGPTFE